jgi:hypothetical protein
MAWTTAGSVWRSGQALRARGRVSVWRLGGAAGEAHLGNELVGLEQRDVLHQQAGEPLPLAVGGARILPQAGHVRRQRQDLGLLALVQDVPVERALAPAGGLRIGEVAEPGVRLRLEHVRHQAVVGVHTAEALLRQVGLVLCAHDVLAPQPVGLGGPGLELLLDLQGHRQGLWSQCRDQQRAERRVQDPTEHALADGLAAGDASLLEFATLSVAEGAARREERPLTADAGEWLGTSAGVSPLGGVVPPAR